MLNNSVTQIRVLSQKHLKGKLQDSTPSLSPLDSCMDKPDNAMARLKDFNLDTLLPKDNPMDTVHLTQDSSACDSPPPGVSLSFASPSGAPFSVAGS